MTENESINGWTFEETIKTTENLMEAENNMFKWDVLRHLRDFAENFKDELQQYRAIGTPAKIYEKIGGLDIELGKYYSIGTVEEFQALKEKSEPKKIIHHKQRVKNQNGCFITEEYWECPHCGKIYLEYYSSEYCECGQHLGW